jgi:hypothetical protein
MKTYNKLLQKLFQNRIHIKDFKINKQNKNLKKIPFMINFK